MMSTCYENVHLAERTYPNFNDVPHQRPILANSGGGRALAILAGVLGSLTGLDALLTLLR